MFLRMVDCVFQDASVLEDRVVWIRVDHLELLVTMVLVFHASLTTFTIAAHRYVNLYVFVSAAELLNVLDLDQF